MSLTPREFAFWPDEASATYGLLFCDDDEGHHWTLRGDPDLVRMIRDAPPGVLADAELGSTWERLEGWPDEW